MKRFYGALTILLVLLALSLVQGSNKALSYLIPIIAFVLGVFASEKIGYAKPDKRFFQACHTALCHKIPDLKPAQMLMIGDSVTADITGAQAFGMHTVWFCRDPALSPCVHAEHTITSLNQVCALL